VETIGPTTVQFHARFYLYALLFVIFDVEAVFLFPWAVSYHQLGFYGLVAMAIFVGLLLVGYAYAWRKGARDGVPQAPQSIRFAGGRPPGAASASISARQ
jgi:NADH-quinone oxidoreductase subunit A